MAGSAASDRETGQGSLLGDAPVLRQLLIEAGSIEFDPWPLYLRAPLGHFFGAFIHEAQK